MVRLLFLHIFFGFICLSSPVLAQENSDFYDKIMEQQQNTNEETDQNAPVKTEQERYIEQLKSIQDEEEIELPFATYDQIPTEALDEMQDFHAMCEQGFTYKMHYNCECLATRYLEERIRRGPDVPQTTIITTINGECVDRGKAAGTAYQQCQTAGGLVYNGRQISPEEYCECVANNYAIILDRLVNTPITRKIMQKSMSSALMRCNELPYGTINPLPRLDRKAREDQ